MAGSSHPTNSDEGFRDVLSTVVHEASFLVENNLSHLVEDIDLKEQELFKLDSIFSVVGIEGESEVLKIIQVNDVLVSCIYLIWTLKLFHWFQSSLPANQSSSFKRDSILKAIRAFVEEKNKAKQLQQDSNNSAMRSSSFRHSK